MVSLRLALLLLVHGAARGGLDEEWLGYLSSPPTAAVEAGKNLTLRADRIAEGLGKELRITGDVDVVVSGGGNFDGYYMGIAMVMSRVSGVRVHRYAGVSAGGMMPFEIELKGEKTTLLTHLAYGALTAEHPWHYASTITAAYLQDHHWRLMAAWQTNHFSDRLSLLDGKVFLGTSCLHPILPKLVMVSNFTAEKDQATHAFMATGTYLETYDGMICSDGGATSGPRMTPLFQDGLRPQVIVDLLRTGYPSSMVYRVDTKQYISLIMKGQDDAAHFLQAGSLAGGAISLCPLGATVDKNICDTSTQVLV